MCGGNGVWESGGEWGNGVRGCGCVGEWGKGTWMCENVVRECGGMGDGRQWK